MPASALLSTASSLRWRILLPLIVGLILLGGIFIAALSALERAHFKEDLAHDLNTAAAYHRDALALRGDKLAAAAETLARDPALRRAMAAGSRQRLLEHADPLFRHLKQDFNVTHFYFLDAGRRTLLRLHDPASFGDRNERVTAREAERSGKPAVGVELGKTGSYTLRAVVPVREGGRLLGYIELGEEVLDSALDLSKAFKLDVYVLLYKSHLVRQDWERFMRSLGRTPQWEHCTDLVIAAQTRADVPKFLDAMITTGESAISQQQTTQESGKQTYNVGFLPLRDAENREVGRLVLLSDVSGLRSQVERQLIWSLVMTGIGGIVLCVFFYFHLGRAEGDLNRAQALLVEAAEAREAEQRRHIEELAERINELERFERLTVGRELRIQTLKEENRRLRAALDKEGEEHGG
jgi:hypothetical protein